jgi:hypothetical protein
MVMAGCIILHFSAMTGSRILQAEESTGKRIIDIEEVEDNIHKLRKSISTLEEVGEVPVIHMRKDPFVSLIKDRGDYSKTDAIVEEKIVKPDFSITGIISNGSSSLAIIGDEVKQEGEFVGEFEVYRIDKSRVLVKNGEDIFPIEIKK